MTPEGFLRVTGRINGCGVYGYENEAGEKWGELRVAEHVGHPDVLESWKLRAMTDDHQAWITAANIDQYRRGSTGSDARFDGEFTWVDIVIDSPELIAKIRGGKYQLSCGYSCILVKQRGVFGGVEYHFIQTEIYGNHVAVVDMARGGPLCALVFDTAAAVRSQPAPIRGHMDETQEEKNDAKLVTSEGAIEIPPEKLAAVMALLADPEPAPAVVEPAAVVVAPVDADMAADPESRDDAIAAKVAMLEAANKQLRDDFSTKVSDRVSLVTKAREVLGDGVTKLDSMGDNAIKVAVVKAVAPTVKLDGKSSDFIAASYAMALEAHARKLDSSGELMGLTGRALNTDGGGESLDAIYDKMIKERRDGVEKVGA